MKRIETLERMGRQYLADTYGADKDFYNMEHALCYDNRCWVHFTDEYTNKSHSFEWELSTGIVTYSLFCGEEFEGEKEIAQLEPQEGLYMIRKVGTNQVFGNWRGNHLDESYGWTNHTDPRALRFGTLDEARAFIDNARKTWDDCVYCQVANDETERWINN